MTTRNRYRGFTLLELMITVAVVAILAAVAYPSYTEYIAKSRRATTVGLLQQAQQWMERFYTENYRYDKNSAGTAVTDASQFPAWFKYSPKDGDGSPVYDITVTVTDGVRDVYSIKAARKAGTNMANDRCGNYTLDQYGRKKLENYDATRFSSDAKALEYCWK